MVFSVKAAVLSAAAGSLLTATAVSAQNVSLGAGNASVDQFTRNRNVSVSSRPRPDYEASGIRAGRFLLFPRLEVEAEFDDNIYAASSGEIDDIVWHVRPEVSIESDWSTNFVTAYVRGSINRYADNSGENTDEYGFGASGRLDVSRLSNIAAGADHSSSFEPRTSPSSPTGAVEPVAVTSDRAYVSGSRTAGRLKLAARADLRQSDYEDGRRGVGTVIDQDFRDQQKTSVTARADVALSPATAVFLQVTGNERAYDVASTVLVPNRDSTGTEYLAGANFELGAVARGEVAAGYIEQQYDEPVYGTVSGFGARAEVEWFVTQLTTVSVRGSRTIEDAVNPGASGYLSTSVGVAVDHELLRNVVLNGRLSYSDNEYEGIDRQDGRFNASVGGTYFVNRNLGIHAEVSTMQSNSSGGAADSDYSVNTVSVGLVTQF